MTTIASKAGGNVDPSAGELAAIYRTMWRIRHFENRAIELFLSGQVKGTAHSYVGQEAIAAAVCSQLARDDYIASYHRGHGHAIAKGASLDRMMAELLGRRDGFSMGLGGSMHIADLENGMLGANGIVGAGIGIATGAALSKKLRGDPGVVVAFFGDGASNEGIFHEAINIASLWKLPIVYFCENNQYGLSTALADVIASPSIAARAAAYSIPGERIDGNDAAEVYRSTRIALDRARAGEGPTLIEATTYRWGDHSMRANLPRYRSEEEEADWKAQDPLVRLRAVLGDTFDVAAHEMDTIAEEAAGEVEAAIASAMDAPPPSRADMLGCVYAPHYTDVDEPADRGTRMLGMVEALNEALAQEMERDERVFVMGEDVAKIGGIFGVTRGLHDRYGARVIDTPISENAISNMAMGAALTGLRPVVEVQIFDFVTFMMDMIVNQAAKFRFMLGGKTSVPLVVRGPQGGGVRLAAQHSQCLEAWFAHVPGLVVLAPSDPYTAKGLLVAAMREDNPVIFLEHKFLYVNSMGPVPEALYTIPIGKAEIRRPGTDVTLVAIQAMVPRALQAASQLAREGIEVEVIDPRTLRPLDEDTILDSVRKTSRCIVAHEAVRTGGIGAEISALIMEKAFDWLDAPVVRLAGLDVPMPYNEALEREATPSKDDIVQAVREIMGR